MNCKYITKNDELCANLVYPPYVDSLSVGIRTKETYIALLNKALCEGTYENEKLYISASISSLKELHMKSDSSIKRTLLELEKVGLIERKRQGGGKVNKIFIKKIEE